MLFAISLSLPCLAIRVSTIPSNKYTLQHRLLNQKGFHHGIKETADSAVRDFDINAMSWWSSRELFAYTQIWHFKLKDLVTHNHARKCKGQFAFPNPKKKECKDVLRLSEKPSLPSETQWKKTGPTPLLRLSCRTLLNVCFFKFAITALGR